jgi:murein DD-endopeptidase MepM/ murein hydrolase activator NlpD
VHALPTRRPPSHPSAWRPRALLPTALLWLASLMALVAPASLVPALADDSPSAPPGDQAHPAVPLPAPHLAPSLQAAGQALHAAGVGAAVDRAGAGAASHPAGSIPAARAPVASRVPALRPPVEGPLVRGFEEAAGPFGPGHRGVDFGGAPGVPVRAPASGRVTFAGLVAGTTWVSIQVAPGVLVTLGPLRTLEASAGQAAVTGDRLGTLASGHGGADPSVAALHLGLRVDGTYIDPLPWLVGLARPRLAPLPEPGGPH